MKSDEPCKFCDKSKFNIKMRCGEKGSGWICTREEGHNPPHIACGVFDHEIHIWEGGEDGER